MRLRDAIRRAEKLVDQLKAEDAVAVHVLVETCKRLERWQKPLRQLADVFVPTQAPVNQQELFRDAEDVESSDG